ncbi:hypothetical protein [Botrimarina hoheduenensis]|uniref:Fructose-bisphosphate aldolase n=1 Tax=Botrimarina hoheduenensis TaxID=2528000 RepID=A0A5C5VWJ9_9BACT|nr:hypothetical protein [Botrimarina hoheduenensis]TWT42904.1 hypothetical protein Pla111_25420 [Botrimarina hoheduenensis]
MPKVLDQKLAEIHADPSGSKAFLLADAKDADMAFGMAAPGTRSNGSSKTLADYRNAIRAVVRQGLVDLVLMSASSVEQIVIKEGLFRDSPVTPAGRANDTTDIWIIRGSHYAATPSRPFRSATLDHLKHGQLVDDPAAPGPGVDLGLYSLTFSGDTEADLRTLEAFAAFRLEAEQKGFRYFLEVFNPNVAGSVPDSEFGGFLNDHIARSLAGVTSVGRPLFLKIPYNGPAALEELVAYDPHLVVGVLGGSAGTSRDAFQLIAEARRYGARIALLGRKINAAEDQLAFIEHLRSVADGNASPSEAVRSYHGHLQTAGVAPHRSLEDDLMITNTALSYSA